MLQLLNCEFFEEIRKKEENDVIHHFGPRVGKLLCNHANLEEKFVTVCVEDGVKMSPIDHELTSEEARQTALAVRDNTAKLIRIFSDREHQLKLKQW